MNLLKNSPLEIKGQETRKKLAFFFKFLLFFGIVFLRINIPLDFTFIHSILKGGLFFIPFSIFVSAIRLVILYLYKKKKKQRNFQDNFIIGINQIASLINSILVFVSLLIVFQITAHEFYTSISIIAVALVLIFKDYISNTLNGMVLMFSNQLALSDYVKIGNQKGQVVNINMKNVVLCNDNEALVYIPNTNVTNGEVVNYTKEAKGKILLELDLGDIDPASVPNMKPTVFKDLANFERYINLQESSIRISKVSKDGVSFTIELSVAGQLLGTATEKDIISAVNYSVLQYTRKTAVLKKAV